LPLIKVVGATRVFIRRPIYSVQNIPQNFYRNVFVLDLSVPPQVILGSDEVDSDWSKINAYTVFKNFFELQSELTDETYQRHIRGCPGPFFSLYVPSMLGLFFLVIPLTAIAFSFRFAVKSTALFWLPLLWVIYQSQPGANVLDRIRINVTQPRAKLILVYSLFVALAFILKVALIFGVWKFENLDWLGPLGNLATGLVAPFELPLWQVTSAFNAGLAWAYFFQAERHLLAKNSTEAWPNSWIEREYVAFQAIRTVFSLYSIACTLCIAAVTAWDINLPPIHFIVFPKIGS
jgi:hypothetical protein